MKGKETPDDTQIEEVIDELEDMDLFGPNEIDDIVSSYDEYWSSHKLEDDVMI